MNKLLVLPTVKHVISSTISNFGFAFHISWPWMLALLPLNVAVNLYAVSLTLTGTPPLDPYLVSSGLLLLVASTIAFASIAVSWHRYILLDEIPHGWKRLRLDGVVWRYVGNSILAFVIMFVAGGVIGFLAVLVFKVMELFAGKTVMLIILIPVAIALFFFAVTSSIRLMTKLPAVALGRHDYGFGDAWRDSSGNFWRLAGFVLLIGIVLAVAGGLASLLAIPLNGLGFVGISVSLFIQLAVNWIGTIMGVTMLTSLYGVFYEGRAV